MENTAPKTLADWLPSEYRNDDAAVKRLKGKLTLRVIADYFTGNAEPAFVRWPGDHKNVHAWCLLSDGTAVGWNESPSHGMSFPSLKLYGQDLYTVEVRTENRTVYVTNDGTLHGDADKAALMSYALASTIERNTPNAEKIKSPTLRQFVRFTPAWKQGKVICRLPVGTLS